MSDTPHYLNGAQFMTVDHLKNMPSMDSRTGGTVGDMLPQKRADMARDPGTYDLLRSSMRKGQTGAIGVNEGVVFDGHHRIALADEMGIKHLRVSDNWEDTGDDKWDRLSGHMP